MSANALLHDDGLNALMLNEMEEINKWARVGTQTCFAGFTLLLTVNGLALSWLFAREGGAPTPRASLAISFLFIVLNMNATIGTFRIRKHLLENDSRIKTVIEALARRYATNGVDFDLKSPVPLRAIDTMTFGNGVALIFLTLFWFILAILAIFAGRFTIG